MKDNSARKEYFDLGSKRRLEKMSPALYMTEGME